jgi:hypothetical protein
MTSQQQRADAFDVLVFKSETRDNILVFDLVIRVIIYNPKP